MNFDWKCCYVNLSQRKFLEEILPPDYKYKITSFNVIETTQFLYETKFSSKILVNICSEDKGMVHLKNEHIKC